jgi:hypothetical protein
MATNITSYGSLVSNLTSTSTGTLIINGNSNITSSYSWIDTNKDIKDFVEFVLDILGIDLKYEDFIKMSDSDKRSFIRNWKLNQILKNNEE